MKKLLLIVALLAGVMFSVHVKAQAPADYFPGKWNVTVFGTPNGDAKLTFVLARVDGKLGGTVRDSTDKEISKISQIEEKDKTITAYFTAEGYDLDLKLEPVDVDSLKGTLMGMFEAKGIRVKDSDAKRSL